MFVVSEKMVSSRLREIKIKLNDLSYKRLEFLSDVGDVRTVQWLHKGEYLYDEMEKTMENIYQNRESI